MADMRADIQCLRKQMVSLLSSPANNHQPYLSRPSPTAIDRLYHMLTQTMTVVEQQRMQLYELTNVVHAKLVAIEQACIDQQRRTTLLEQRFLSPVVCDTPHVAVDVMVVSTADHITTPPEMEVALLPEAISNVASESPMLDVGAEATPEVAAEAMPDVAAEAAPDVAEHESSLETLIADGTSKATVVTYPAVAYCKSQSLAHHPPPFNIFFQSITCKVANKEENDDHDDVRIDWVLCVRPSRKRAATSSSTPNNPMVVPETLRRHLYRTYRNERVLIGTIDDPALSLDGGCFIEQNGEGAVLQQQPILTLVETLLDRTVPETASRSELRYHVSIEGSIDDDVLVSSPLASPSPSSYIATSTAPPIPTKRAKSRKAKPIAAPALSQWDNNDDVETTIREKTKRELQSEVQSLITQQNRLMVRAFEQTNAYRISHVRQMFGCLSMLMFNLSITSVLFRRFLFDSSLRARICRVDIADLPEDPLVRHASNRDRAWFVLNVLVKGEGIRCLEMLLFDSFTRYTASVVKLVQFIMTTNSFLEADEKANDDESITPAAHRMPATVYGLLRTHLKYTLSCLGVLSKHPNETHAALVVILNRIRPVAFAAPSSKPVATASMAWACSFHNELEDDPRQVDAKGYALPLLAFVFAGGMCMCDEDYEPRTDEQKQMSSDDRPIVTRCVCEGADRELAWERDHARQYRKALRRRLETQTKNKHAQTTRFGFGRDEVDIGCPDEQVDNLYTFCMRRCHSEWRIVCQLPRVDPIDYVANHPYLAQRTSECVMAEAVIEQFMVAHEQLHNNNNEHDEKTFQQ